MIVNDDVKSRYTLAAMLRAEGYVVQSASGHESWLALFKTCLSVPATWVSFVAAMEPDAVLLDVHMNGGGGLVTLGELRRHPLTSGVPVVVIGKPSKQRLLDAALALGAARYAHLPLSRTGLKPVVDAALATVHDDLPARTGDEVPVLYQS